MKILHSSEFELIDWIRERAPARDPEILRSIGDDCAIFQPEFGKKYSISSDLLVEGIHFNLDWISPRLLGRKSVLVNLSDLAAMGAHPCFCLLGLVMPGQSRESFFRPFIEGFCQECDHFGLSLVGGDLSAGDRITISVTVVGLNQKGEPVLRSTAEPEDQVFLIGQPGLSRTGLEFLQINPIDGLKSVNNETQLSDLLGDRPEKEWLKAHLLPEIMLYPAQWLTERSLVHSMIDVSDGLGSDFYHILEESGLSGEIFVDRLPPVIGISNYSYWKKMVIDGGEDYCLLGTCNSTQAAEIEEDYPPNFPPVKFIGRVFSGKPKLYLVEDEKRTLYRKKGFDHFR